MMTPNEYQKAAMRTSLPDQGVYNRLINGALGLTGETGEVADLVKKFLYQGHDLDRQHVMEELGDVLWYVALTLDAIGSTMEDCMIYNVEKLKRRYPNGFEAYHSVHRDEDEEHWEVSP